MKWTPATWAAFKTREAAADKDSMLEAHDAIARIKAGENVRVSDRCMEEFGENIKYQRENQGKKRD